MTDTNARTVCLQYEAVLEDYLEGVLDEAGAEAVRRHLRDCPGCGAALDRAAGSVRLLRIAEPSQAPGQAFARNVMARIRSAEQQRTAERAVFWQPFVVSGWRFAGTAALALGVLLTCDIGWSHYARLNLASARSVDRMDMFAPEPARAPSSKDEVPMMVAETNHAKQ